MRKVYVSFEVSVAQSKEHPLIIAQPDYVFSGEYNKDDHDSMFELLELEARVLVLSKSLKALGCQVAVFKKETSSLDID